MSTMPLKEIDTNTRKLEREKTKGRVNPFVSVLEQRDDIPSKGVHLHAINDEGYEENESNKSTRNIVKPATLASETDGDGVMVVTSHPKPGHKSSKPRRRRRSSARFLRLTDRFGDDNGEGEDEYQEPVPEKEQLGEMYKRAIRMNAENRINAGNSWSLRLIENIDKFLGDDHYDADQQVSSRTSISGARDASSKTKKEKRVNFTKASCTLDASVKIYSYRVDDVHLTSYKVLANLNRNDATGRKKKSAVAAAKAADDPCSKDGDDGNPVSQKRERSATETLENNPANLNLNKLDSAYDIDPLFHKMSKTFDEGGAKGLLLVNLGVGSQGCNIVFDSKEESEEMIGTGEKDKPDDEAAKSDEGVVDISSLVAKLSSSLSGTSLDSIALVPQLRMLRDEYAALEADGFVDHDMKSPRSQRYATPFEEEKEAEMSIHQEALERSRMSQAAETHDEDGMYAPDDFGGDDHGDDDDCMFSDLPATDEDGNRYSSASFQGESYGDDTPADITSSRVSTSALLDELCSGNSLKATDYEFFSRETLENLSQGNQWAGSAHWKKTEKLRRKTKQPHSAKKRRRKKEQQPRAFVDLQKPPKIDSILRSTAKPKKSCHDPFQLTKAIKSKHDKSNNLLPLDTEYSIETMSSLFLRPASFMAEREQDNKRKTVGFHPDIESFETFDDCAYNDSFGGGDDDHDGFQLRMSDASEATVDYVAPRLDDVRKVEKIKIGYATVAKKVDVRRLKQELWTNLESTFLCEETSERGGPPKEIEASDCEAEPTEPKTSGDDTPDALSFQETVREMEVCQSQSDVTLPFYFICVLHLANEKSLRLDSQGLTDFLISMDGV